MRSVASGTVSVINIGCAQWTSCMQLLWVTVSLFWKGILLCFMIMSIQNLSLCFRFLSSSSAILVNWLSKSAKNTSDSASTLTMWRLLFSLVACPSRRTSRSWKQTALTLWLEPLEEFWLWSATRASTWNMSSILSWTNVTRCLKHSVSTVFSLFRQISLLITRLFVLVIYLLMLTAHACFIHGVLFCRYASWCPGDLPYDPSWEASDDVQRYPVKGNPPSVQGNSCKM